MRWKEVKDTVMVRKDYQRQIKFGNFRPRYIGRRKQRRVIGSGVFTGKFSVRTCWRKAWQHVSRNGGAAGVDGESIDEIAATSEQLEKWLAELKEELRSKRYSPSPLRRVLIPKANGGQRPLGIQDRVAQMAAYLVLMPIFEAEFHPHSYGFRPTRRAQQAVEAIRDTLRKGKTEVIDADLSKYFDTIPHSLLLRQLAKRISDGAVLSLIKQWLKAPVVEEREASCRQSMCRTSHLDSICR